MGSQCLILIIVSSEILKIDNWGRHQYVFNLKCLRYQEEKK